MKTIVHISTVMVVYGLFCEKVTPNHCKGKSKENHCLNMKTNLF